MRKTLHPCLGLLFVVLALSVSATPVQGQPTCGPGAHWIDGCTAGDTDTMQTGALIGLDTNLDNVVDQNLVLFGPATVVRDGAAVSTPRCGDGPAGHSGPDVINTELASMSLTGGGHTLIAGAGQGGIPAANTSLGCITEQAANNTLGDSFFDVFFELQHASLGSLFNHTPLRVEAVIDRVPPQDVYIHVITAPIDLFDDPTTGTVVARLVTANHDTDPPAAPALSGLATGVAVILLMAAAAVFLLRRRQQATG